VGLAPAAAALLAVRDRFGDGVLGPLSDFLSTDRQDAELAERLLGEWMHAVLVRDEGVIPAIQAWHAEAQPGAIVLLPAHPGPRGAGDVHPLVNRMRAEGPAAAWVHAALAGSEVLDESGQVLRRASGAVFLPGRQAQSGPLRRRAELASLVQDVAEAERRFRTAEEQVAATVQQLADAERALHAADAAAEAAGRRSARRWRRARMRHARRWRWSAS